MKIPRALLSIVISVLLVGSAFAREAGPRVVTTPNSESAVADARSRYVQAEDTRSPEEVLAEMRQTRKRLRPSRVSYQQGNPYGNSWAGGGKRVAIGAAIGFGIGTAMALKVSSDNHADARGRGAAILVFGGLGALLGAVAAESWH